MTVQTRPVSVERVNTSPTTPATDGANRASFASNFKAAAFVFVVTLAVALLFHALEQPPRRALCFDARQYLSNTQQIAQFLLGTFAGKVDINLITNKAFVEAIQTDGPVFPVLFGSVFAILGHVPSISDWRLIQTLQSVMHAGAAALVHVLYARMSASSRWGMVAGLIWGLYPAAIFWSGIFYTETTVVFFTLLFLAVSATACGFRAGLLQGVTGGLVVLLKPALVPPAILTSLYGNDSKKKLLAVVLGLFLCVAPWAVYTKLTTGHARLTAYRNPSFNLAMGADTEVDGCYVWPGAPLTTMFAQDDCPIAFPLAQWQYHTADCLRMSCRKLSALWGAQSNDLRQSFFGASAACLNLWHGVIASLGFAGLFMFLAGGFKKVDQSRRKTGIALAIFVVGHLVYLLFTPTARYGFTAMPMLCIMAVYLLQSFFCNALRPGRKCLALTVVATSCWLPLLFFGEQFGRSGEPQEVAHNLMPGESAIKEIDLTSNSVPENIDQVAILFDGDEGLSDAEISLNGIVLAEKPCHLRTFSSRVYDRCWDLRSLGYPMGISQDQFRQWKAVIVDKSMLHLTGNNIVTVSRRNGSCTVFSNKDPKCRKFLSPDYCSVNNISNSPDNLDPRIVSQVPSASVHQRSMLHKSNGSTLLDTNDSLRIVFCMHLKEQQTGQIRHDGKVLHDDKQGQPRINATKPLTETFEHAFKMDEFDLFMQDKTTGGIRTNKHVLKAAQRAGAVIPISNPPLEATHMLIQVTGQLKAVGPDAKAGIVVAVLPARGNASLTLAATPDFVPASNQWAEFKIEDRVPLSLLSDSKKSLYFALYPGPWLDICGYGPTKNPGDIQVKDIRAQVSYDSEGDFAQGRVLYY